MGWMSIPSFPSSSVPSPPPVIALPMFHPLRSLLFFPSPVKFNEEVLGSIARTLLTMLNFKVNSALHPSGVA